MSAVGIGLRAKEIDIPAKTSQKVDRIIRAGVALRKRLNEVQQAIEANNLLIIPHAENMAGISGQKKVGFQSKEGFVEIRFSDNIVYRESDMTKIKVILGPVFDQAFSRETAYALNLTDIPEIKRLLGKNYDQLVKEQTIHKHKKKLRDMLCDGDSETSKKLREVILIEPNKPSITFLKPEG